MATSRAFGSIAPTEARRGQWRDAGSRRLPFPGGPCWARTAAAARSPGRAGVRLSRKAGLREMQHLGEMPESFSGCSEPDGLRGGRVPGEGLALERAEESSAGGRREFIASSVFLLPWVCRSAWNSSIEQAAAAAAAEDTIKEVPLELYSDIKDGFTLMRPAPWNKVDKPGASIFFEDPMSRSNNIGVTVAPVRIASLNGFGTVDDIVKKLVKAERDKPSTNDVQVITVLERKLRDNIPLYSLEYTLDTTRGSKRVLTSVTIAGYKLYILNIIFTDGPVAPASQGLNDALHQVLNSFELLA